MLGTISERGTSSPSRLLSPRRIQLSKRSYASSSYTPRPIHINTADIDVSRDRYRQKAPSPPPVPPRTKTPSPEKENGPFMPRVDGKPVTGIDSSPGIQRSTIKRGRTVVRLHTIKRKERDSPHKPQSDETQSKDQEVGDHFENCVDCIVDDVEKNVSSELVRWREKLSDDLAYKDKRQKKTLGARLVEKFIVRDKDSDSDGSIKEKPKKLDVVSRLPETPVSISSSPRIQSPDRRCSIEMLAEQASLLDSLIRGENLSTATLDISKVGVEEDCKIAIEPPLQSKRRKSIDKDNPLKTTKSDQTLHESLKSFKDSKHFSKKRSLKKSSSAGGNICRLDSITEFPKDSILPNLPPIEECSQPIKRGSIKTKPKSKLRTTITSSVEVSEPKSPLKFIVENIIVEENPRIPKKEIIYSTVVDEVQPKQQTSESTSKDESTPKTIKKQMKYDTKKITKTLVIEDNVPEIAEPDDGNFWDKIGKRETVYLIKRKQFIEDNRAQNRRAMFWFPEDDDSGPNNDHSVFEETENLSIDKIGENSEATGNKTSIQAIWTDDGCESILIDVNKQLTLLTKTENDNNQEEGNGLNTIALTNINKVVLETEEILISKKEIVTEGDVKDCNVKNKSTCVGKVTDFDEVMTDGKELEDPSLVQKPTDNKKKSPTPDKSLIIERKIHRKYMSVESKDEQKNLYEVNSIETKKKSPTPDKTLIPKATLDDKLKSAYSMDEQKQIEKKNSIEAKKESPDKISVSEHKLDDRLKSVGSIDKTGQINKENNIETKKISLTPDKILSSKQKSVQKHKSEESNVSTESVMEPCRKEKDNSKSNVNTSVTSTFTEEKPNAKGNEIGEQHIESKSSDTKQHYIDITKIKPLDKLQQKFGDKLKTFENNAIDITFENKKDLNEKKIATAFQNMEAKVTSDTNVKTNPDPSKDVSIVAVKSKPENEELTQTALNSKNKKVELDEIKNSPAVASEPLVEKIIKRNSNDKILNKDIDSKVSKDSAASLAPQSDLAQSKVAKPLTVTSSFNDDTLQKISEPSSLMTPLGAIAKDDTTEGQLNQPINNHINTNGPSVHSIVLEAENIPSNENETLRQENKTGEDKKAENINKKEEKQEEITKLSVKDVIKQPAPARKLIKQEAAVRPLIATPRPLQKKTPQIIHSSSSSDSSSEEESSDDEDADESDTSEGSTEFFECENNPDGRTSTGSNDSGFDSSAPNSPAGFLQIKKGKIHYHIT